ncbi:pentapeptide repeat-containing protein [Pseudanabaena sp. PCC 6802]|uniref:pentapeptide repeat-containing protein n=1 Tax=Pseudanabaena sp. PCC 6802 TaxID=118173 RepID=UPI000345604C|nr:pentapeptide repeat-containing protein [Pseudanabaena sp. PCC 6802]
MYISPNRAIAFAIRGVKSNQWHDNNPQLCYLINQKGIAKKYLEVKIVKSINLLFSVCLLFLAFPAFAGNDSIVSVEEQKFMSSLPKKYGCWIGTSDLSQKENFAASLNNCKEEVTKKAASVGIGRLVHEADLRYFTALQRKFPIPKPNPDDLKQLKTKRKCPGCDLRGADLTLSSWSSEIIDECASPSASNCSQLILDNDIGDLSSANLSSANLSRRSVRGISLSRANLRFANLTLASMGNINFMGADLRNAILNGTNLVAANLQKANLEGAFLPGAKLVKADLRGANLQNASLLYANLEGADLRGANLQNASLPYVGLQGADLRGADLRGADLRSATLSKANLLGADLRGTMVTKGRKLNPSITAGSLGICYAILPKNIEAEMDCVNPNPTGPFPNWYLRLRGK